MSELTPKMRDALRLMREHGDPVIGPGGAVVTSGPTHLCDGQPWVNWRTARALEAAGVAVMRGYGDECELVLNEAA